MTRFVTLFLGLAVVLATAIPVLAQDCCDARALDRWCTGCSKGFFADITMFSKMLHDSLAGKKVDAASLGCPGCKTAAEKNGACEHCRLFFANGRAYSSMYAAVLCRGHAFDASAVQCEGCRKAMRENGWCDHCKGGVVSGYAFKDKKTHALAASAHEIIKKAVKASDKCEHCAVAIVKDGACAPCKVTFKGGKKIGT